jgi:hypothetical protein
MHRIVLHQDLAPPLPALSAQLESSYRARYYDPENGRFVSEDPVRFGGGVNFYRYAGNNPTNFVDPLGLNAVPAPIPWWWRILDNPITAPIVEVGAGGAAAIIGVGELILAPATAADDTLTNRKPAPSCPDKGKGCKPCDPPVGTLGYRVSGDKPNSTPSHFDKPSQTTIWGTRWHLYEVSQSPPSAGCRCWWQDLGQAGAFPPPPPGAMPMTGPVGGGGVQ